MNSSGLFNFRFTLRFEALNNSRLNARLLIKSLQFVRSPTAARQTPRSYEQEQLHASDTPGIYDRKLQRECGFTIARRGNRSGGGDPAAPAGW